MDINGCHVVPEPSKTTDEGFLTTVYRDGVVRGPFTTIVEAITAAHVWSQELITKLNAPLSHVDNEAPVVVDTYSDSVAIQIDRPAENPPVIEQKEATMEGSQPIGVTK